MNLSKNETKDISEVALQIADNISELMSLLEKTNVLANDISLDLFEKIDLKSERGRFTAEYDINILRLKWGMILEYIFPAMQISKELITYSNEMVNIINENDIAL